MSPTKRCFLKKEGEYIILFCTFTVPKCKNCTLEEMAVLRVVQQNPSATQKQIAEFIGKSERTVKTLTVRLIGEGIIVRRNGKRNGYWEIIKE